MTTTLELELRDDAINAAANTVRAAPLVLNVSNRDRAPHDVVLLRTALEPDELPTSGITVDERDPALEVVARTSRLEPLATGTIATTVGPGTYVLVCSVPHHDVRDAMVADLSVTG